MTRLQKCFGDRRFFRVLAAVLIPIVIQNTFSQFVSLLDNLMVGQLGDEAIAAAAIANQLLLVFNLAIFGFCSGGGIFSAQYAGKEDWEGVRTATRFKMLIGIVVLAIGTAIILLFDRPLMQRFLTEDGQGGDIELALNLASEYIRIMLIGMPAFVMANIYASTLRETGKTVLPMVASIIAVVVNFCLNALLIFGLFGLPALGTKGAAIATVVSRYIELGVMMIGSHCSKKHPFAKGLYRSLRVPKELFFTMLAKCLPLMGNEILWSLGWTVIYRLYSLRGFTVASAFSINTTARNVMMIIVFSVGSALATIVGQLLGEGKIEEARRTDRWILIDSTIAAAAVGALAFFIAPLIPMIYKASPGAQDIAAFCIRVEAIILPVVAFQNSCYFTLRSGGNTLITFLFDSGAVWVLQIPLLYCLIHFTGLDVRMVYVIMTAPEFLRVIIGLFLLRGGKWAKNLVSE